MTPQSNLTVDTPVIEQVPCDLENYEEQKYWCPFHERTGCFLADPRRVDAALMFPDYGTCYSFIGSAFGVYPLEMTIRDRVDRIRLNALIAPSEVAITTHLYFVEDGSKVYL